MFAAVTKIGSTMWGLILKRQGMLFATLGGYAIFLLSKLSSIMLAYAAYKYSVVTHDVAGQMIFGWLTVIAAMLVAILLTRAVVNNLTA
jgi:hypothetical protein